LLVRTIGFEPHGAGGRDRLCWGPEPQYQQSDNG
jgi:hypothetical protein